MTLLLATKCWVCDGLIDVQHPAIGLMLEYPDCQALYVVTETDPLELSQAIDPEEDAWFEDAEYDHPRA